MHKISQAIGYCHMTVECICVVNKVAGDQMRDKPGSCRGTGLIAQAILGTGIKQNHNQVIESW
jgi:hypothetical protein